MNERASLRSGRNHCYAYIHTHVELWFQTAITSAFRLRGQLDYFIQAVMKNIQKTRSQTKQLSLKKISLLQLSQLSSVQGGHAQDASGKWTKVDPNI